MAGRLGWGGGPGSSGGVPALFPPEPQPQVLEEGEGELAQERVVVQPAPRAPLEVVEPQLLLELLVHLLAHPPGLDQGRQLLERRVRRQVREVVLALARGPMLADEPRLVTGEVPFAGGGRTVRHAHPQGGELGLERSLGAGPPRDGAERRRPGFDQLGRSHARGGGHRVLARPAGRLALGKGERDVGRVDLLDRHDAHSVGEPSLRKAGAELGRPAGPARTSPPLPYSASARTAPKRAPEASTRSISSSAIRHFGRYATVSGTPAAARRVASPPQSSGRNSRRPTPTGTSLRARVRETSDWQLARLPSWPQYWRLTPTEWRPCFTSAVSSTTSTASGPPTKRSAARTSSSSRGAVAQGEAETKWCSCWVSAGATLAAIGSIVFLSPRRVRAF